MVKNLLFDEDEIQLISSLPRPNLCDFDLVAARDNLTKKHTQTKNRVTRLRFSEIWTEEENKIENAYMRLKNRKNKSKVTKKLLQSFDLILNRNAIQTLHGSLRRNSRLYELSNIQSLLDDEEEFENSFEDDNYLRKRK